MMNIRLSGCFFARIRAERQVLRRVVAIRPDRIALLIRMRNQL